MSAVAHFFMSVGGSKIHERLAHFFIDIYKLRGESFRGKKLETVSLQTGKVPAVEPITTEK